MARRLFRADESGLTESQLRWGLETNQWRRAAHGVYAEGADEVHAVDRARAAVIGGRTAARGYLAGVLHELDGVDVVGAPTRRDRLDDSRLVVIDGVPCADLLQTLVDLAAILDDLQWEQALESALRTMIVTVDDLTRELPILGRSRTSGVARMRRVLGVRPVGAPPTESLLETLMVQLARTIPGLPPPTRQRRVYDDGLLVARVDLCWPELGIFIELDGEHHKGQPLYDARRETAIVAATGWLCGRFTWTEVTRYPNSTARRLARIVEKARRRIGHVDGEAAAGRSLDSRGA